MSEGENTRRRPVWSPEDSAALARAAAQHPTVRGVVNVDPHYSMSKQVGA